MVAREWKRYFCAKDWIPEREKAIPLTYFIAKVNDCSGYWLSLSYYFFSHLLISISLRGYKAKCLFNVIEIDYPIKGSKS